jgi:hypothetical protein
MLPHTAMIISIHKHLAFLKCALAAVFTSTDHNSPHQLFSLITCNKIFFSFLGQSAPGNTPKAGRFTIVF